MGPTQRGCRNPESHGPSTSVLPEVVGRTCYFLRSSIPGSRPQPYEHPKPQLVGQDDSGSCPVGSSNRWDETARFWVPEVCSGRYLVNTYIGRRCSAQSFGVRGVGAFFDFLTSVVGHGITHDGRVLCSHFLLDERCFRSSEIPILSC